MMPLFDEGLDLLTESQCLERLGLVRIGRVAVSVGALPAVFPVNFVFLDGNVYFFTGEGTKLRSATQGAVVAFEVDDFDPCAAAGWSVLVIGQATGVDDPATRARVVAAGLRTSAGGDRHHLVRLSTDVVSGRAVTSGFPVGGAGSIVVGVDGSCGGDEALRWAVREARLLRSRLVVVCAWSMPPGNTSTPRVEVLARDREAVRLEAKATLEHSIVGVLGSGTDTLGEDRLVVEECLAEGSPSEVLAGEAARADLLVVGCRGDGALASRVPGSVSRDCVDHAACPVVVVPGRVEADVS